MSGINYRRTTIYPLVAGFARRAPGVKETARPVLFLDDHGHL